MTDKQIIDPCAKCDVEPPALKFKCPKCEHNKENKQIINITIDDLINENLRDMEFTAQFGVYRQAVKGLAEQLKTKEQECEELKKQITILDDETIVVEITEKQFEEYQQLKKALTEIKEIAYELTNEEYTDFIESKQEQILQKCEVLDE